MPGAFYDNLADNLAFLIDDATTRRLVAFGAIFVGTAVAGQVLGVMLRQAAGRPDATVVLQGSEVASAFICEALPRLAADGLDVEAFYVASVELFDRLPAEERQAVFPEGRARTALGITGFTLPTMYR